MARPVLALLVAGAVALLVPAAAAAADRNALSFSASPTALDDGGSTTLHFHGYTDTASDIDITRKPEGNGGCAPAPSTDGGTPLPGTSPVGVPGARAFDFDEGTTPGADEE